MKICQNKQGNKSTMKHETKFMIIKSSIKIHQIEENYYQDLYF